MPLGQPQMEGQMREALDRAPHGRGHEGADVTCVSSHP